MGFAKFHYSGTSIFILLLVGIVLLGIKTTYAAPYPAISYPRYFSSEAFAGQDPEYLIQTIAKLRQALINNGDIENSKRGLDFGLGRGFSGSQTAKHLMGLAAANFAGGSGRRRRGDTDA